MTRRDFFNSWTFGLVLTGLFWLTHSLFFGGHDFWTDEYITWGSAHYPFDVMLSERLARGHMPTYFMLVRVWCKWIAGWSIESVRMVSTIFASIAFLGFFGLLRRHVGQPAVRYAALALFFFHPFVLWASQEARMYAGLLCFSILAAAAFLRFIRTGKPLDFLLYLLVGALGTSFHLLFALQFAPHLFYAICFHRRRAVPVFAAIGIVAFAVFLAFSEVQPKTEPDKKKEWIHVEGLWKVIHATCELAIGRSDSELYDEAIYKKLEDREYVTSVALFMIFLIAAGFAFTRLRLEAAVAKEPDAPRLRAEYDFWRFVFFWFGLQFVILLIISLFFSRGLGQVRYHTGSLAPVLLILTLGFVQAWGNWGMHAVRVTLVMIMLVLIQRQYQWEGPGVRDISQMIKEEAQPGDAIVFSPNGAFFQAFEVHDLQTLPILGFPKEVVSPSVVLKQVEAFSKDKQRIWVIIYRSKLSPLDKVLLNRPDEYKPIRAEKIRGAEYQLYEIMDKVKASTATLSGSVSLTTNFNRLHLMPDE